MRCIFAHMLKKYIDAPTHAYSNLQAWFLWVIKMLRGTYATLSMLIKVPITSKFFVQKHKLSKQTKLQKPSRLNLRMQAKYLMELNLSMHTNK